MSKSVTLYYSQGASDKVYQVAIEPRGGQFVVNVAYGRRGSTLKSASKTPVPVTADKARKIFDKLVAAKTAKGYTPDRSGSAYLGTEYAGQVSGIGCQLLNAVDEGELAELIASARFCAQEKFDGVRQLIAKDATSVRGVNRKGLYTALPAPVAQAASQLNCDAVILDGEGLGDQTIVFDILSLDGVCLRKRPYRERLDILDELLAGDGSALGRVTTQWTAEGKAELLEQVRSAAGEGVVFKDIHGPYTPGRPASGGDQRKFKLYATASVLITGRNEGKRSVAMALRDGQAVVPVGNVTIPANHPVPEVGAVAEVRYLYAHRGGSLFQPVYLGLRGDVGQEDCDLTQLKYKAA